MAATAPARRVVRFEAFEVDLCVPELRHGERRIRIQEQPFQVLAALLERPGELVTREELQRRVWSADTFVDFDAGLNIAIKKLRDALQDSAETPRFIETVPKRGYRFIGKIETQPARVQGRRYAKAAAAGGALALVAVLALLWFRASAPTEGIRSVTVLPFENFTGDPAQDYLGPAVADILTTELAQVRALRVGSFTSAMYFADQRKPLPEIARDMNVQAVVEGSVHRYGERLSVNVQLIDARTDRNLWAKIYERKSADLAGLHVQIARDVAAALRLPLTPEDEKRLARERSVHPEAYEAYLLGVFHMRRGTQADRVRARDLLLQAIEKDPGYAPAYGRLALLYSHGGGYLAGGPVQKRQLSRDWSARALQLDESLAEAHTARAWVLQTDWDWQGAEQEFRRALELNPNLTVARTWYAQFLCVLRRSDEALHHAERAIELDPASSDVVTHAAVAFYDAGRSEQAISYWRQVIQADPRYPPAHHYLARAYLAKGMYEEAVKAAEAAKGLEGQAVPDQALLAYAYAKAGRRQQARKLLTDLEQRVRKQGQGHTSVAQVYVALGDHDRALAWLEEGYELRAGGMFTLLSNRLLEPLYNDPRYRDLLRRIGFPGQSIASLVASSASSR